MSSETDIAPRLQAAWRAILATEHARGAARERGDDDGAAQAAYEAALATYRLAQIDAFTATLGALPLIWAYLDEHGARLDALERAVGAAPRVGRLEQRADIVDRLVFADPTIAE